jgi:hypothetical protein
MTKNVLLGASLAAAFAISMFAYVMADDGPREKYMELVSATNGTDSSITVNATMKQIPAHKALDVITFWALPIEYDVAQAGGALNVAAVTIHHGVNDHQYVGSIDNDPKPVNQSVRSTPVQSFHPHYAGFDGDGCLVGLESPKLDFRVKGDTITFDTSDHPTVGFAVTGTIGLNSTCATGLQITHVDDALIISP